MFKLDCSVNDCSVNGQGFNSVDIYQMYRIM